MKKRTAGITRRMTFSAAHRLHCAELTDAENADVFGKCNHANGHGHNYVVEVTVFGPIDPRTGMVINLRDLKQVMSEVIVEHFDHKNLNLDVAAFKSLNPTAENIAAVIWDMLSRKLPKGMLREVRLVETENNFVSYRG